MVVDELGAAKAMYEVMTEVGEECLLRKAFTGMLHKPGRQGFLACGDPMGSGHVKSFTALPTQLERIAAANLAAGLRSVLHGLRRRPSLKLPPGAFQKD